MKGIGPITERLQQALAPSLASVERFAQSPALDRVRREIESIAGRAPDIAAQLEKVFEQ